MFNISTSRTNARTNSEITKKTLYIQLANKYFLPPKDGNGVSRKYLEKVQEGSVFRVNIIELNMFLAGLTAKQLLKNPFICRWQA